MTTPPDGQAPESEIKFFPAYFDHHLGCYWVENEQHEFIRINERNLNLRLRDAGYSTDLRRGERLHPLDRRLLQIQQNHSVAYAAPLAGYRKGQYTIEGNSLLVINSPALIVPNAGDWTTLRECLCNMLGEQQVYVYGWLKVALEYLRQNQQGPGQALVLAGEHDCGKSLIQNLFTVLLGSRSAKPYRYMTEQTSFNSELFAAEHLMIEDEPASSDVRIRRKFGSYIKIVTVSETQSFHAKNRPALTLKPFWRLTISVNIEPHNLRILPELEDSLNDKVILLKATKFPMPMPTRTTTERKAFWDKLVSELPAFVDFLLRWDIPTELRSERFGITHYHHPEIRKTLDTVTPEMRMLELIDRTVLKNTPRPWEGTAAELKALLEFAEPKECSTLFDFDSAVGTFLGRLAKHLPNRVEKRGTGNGNRWIIFPRRDEP